MTGDKPESTSRTQPAPAPDKPKPFDARTATAEAYGAKKRRRFGPPGLAPDAYFGPVNPQKFERIRP